ncbi:DNA translocase FtsK [Lentisphaera marina]|uniref:DNA translocase FtsK n=1 Tax=Lentisphaera marina TaxID=1111041 RepID=UPI0023663F68|nr:DNA translocase FtsK [Lentisphaera marina]MDD7984753.1 DNA translocase FtsK [Lentisphaera marina]
MVNKEDKEAAKKVFRTVKGLVKNFFSNDPRTQVSPATSKGTTSKNDLAAEPTDLSTNDKVSFEADAVEQETKPTMRSYQELIVDYKNRQENYTQHSDQAQVVISHYRQIMLDKPSLDPVDHLLTPESNQAEVSEEAVLEVEVIAEESVDEDALVSEHLNKREADSLNYKVPDLSCFINSDEYVHTSEDWKQGTMETIQDTLDSFRIDAVVQQLTCGPRIARVDIRPAPGVKVSDIARLNNNFAMELHSSSIRILAPVPGQPYVGVEIPSPNPNPVAIRDLFTTSTWTKSKDPLPLVLGRNTSGEAIILDLARAPHLLIAGSTGSGKSVCINTILASLLSKFSPAELELILVDPKVVELSVYGTVPHLLMPVVNDPKKVPAILQWVIDEMKRRYGVLASVGARNIAAFNSRKIKEDEDPSTPKRYPYMVIVIDELADIMMNAGNEVETYLAQIAQLSRAVGIHTIIATQRPSVDVLTGIIKANYPTRIAFKVSSQIDSRVILDTKGAESLLGQGDMLFRAPGGATSERLQGALVRDEEIEDLVKECSSLIQADFDNELAQLLMRQAPKENEEAVDTLEIDNEDSLLHEAIEIIRQDRKSSISYIQRRLRIGYNRAASIVEELENRGILGPQKPGGKREIFLD